MARITDGSAPELLQKLAHRYIGPDAKFPPMDNPPSGVITRVTPTRIGGIGPPAERLESVSSQQSALS